MSNYTGLKTELKNSIIAKTPFIIVNSAEMPRVRSMLAEISNELNAEVDFYTDCMQFVGLLDKSKRANAFNAPLVFMEDVLKKKTGQIFAVGDIRYIENDNAFSRQLMSLVYLAKESRSTLIIITADAVWQRLGQLGIYFSLSLPTLEERAEIIKKFVNENSKSRRSALENEEIWAAATLLSGFSEMQLEMLLSYAAVSLGGISYNNICEIAKKKDKIYGRVLGVEQIEIEGSVHVSGLLNLKKWLSDKRTIFFTDDKLLAKRSIRAPKGILLGGVPGCGKSLSAKMIASEWRLPLYRFDIGAVYDKFVGESEKNMRTALEYIQNVSPCILWIDEIEKMLSVSENTNDTAKRVLGQFLYWLQESPNRVFLVATANEVSLLPAELFRKGRFSEIFFVGLPNEEERKSAIELYCNLALHQEFSEPQKSELVRLSEGFSFADIEMSIKQAAEFAIIHCKETVEYELLKEIFTKSVGISTACPALIERIYDWGRKSAVSAAIEQQI